MASGLVARVVTRDVTAKRTYRRRAYRATPMPAAAELHMLNRMGCGFSLASAKQLRKRGGATEWFEWQLDPASFSEGGRAAAVDDWFPRLRDTPQTVWASDQGDRYQAWEYARDLSNYSLLKRIYSNRTVFENMVEFWSNHLHVEPNHFPGFTQRASYDRLVRQHALGTYEELLVAATLHPAMLLYLDNWKSTKNNFNENHGRELLELHTVGVSAGYTEAEVKASSRILSGHTVDYKFGQPSTFAAFYDPNRHTGGAVSVLGFTHPTGAASEELAPAYLRHLARHPSTAERIARKLAVRFVSDEPSEALVQHVAAAYLASGTDIKATLRALVGHDEFWASRGAKVRTPVDDVVATCRALRVRAQAPTTGKSFAHALSWTLNSTLCFQWPRPDGYPDRASSWATTTRMLNSWTMHANFAGGWYPRQRVVYVAPRKYLPEKRMRFDVFLDHLCRTVLGRRSTALLLQAACQGCDVTPGEIITARHPVVGWKFVRLLAVLLDSPAHMTR
jgi:uncharacterized protein (DUF1800 family)